MDDLGDEILAGAALAGNEHGRAGLDATLRTSVLTRCMRSDSPMIESRPNGWPGVAQRPKFAPQPRRLERARHAQRDVIEVERLGRVVERAGAHGLDDGLDVLVGRQHDDEHVGIEVAQLAQHREAVVVGQLVVEQDEIDAELARSRARRRCRPRRPRVRRRADARRATSESAVRRQRRARDG